MFKPYSKRKREAEGGTPKPYSYDNLPHPLKVQVIHAWLAAAHALPGVRLFGTGEFFGFVRQCICEELGLLRLTGDKDSESDVCNFFLQQRDIEGSLDVIEFVFRCLVDTVRGDTFVNVGVMSDVEQAADKINVRFQEHSIGFELRNFQFIRIDSKFLHREAVVPAMELLNEAYLSGANEEFAKAHEHLRHGLLAEAINECLKAFESTMKGICHKRRWSYDQNDTAKKLLKICQDKGLFPTHMRSSLGALVSVLESVATFRNKLSGHGQGVQPVNITPEIAAFVLHSAAANILLLASLEKELK